MKRLVAGAVLFALVTAAAYQSAVLIAPRAMMLLVTTRLAKVGGVNTITHASRADENQRQVVMPSPDLLYSFCVYDLDQGSLRIHAELPPDTYWSLSAFDAQTDNFFAVDDQNAGGMVIDILLTAQTATVAPAAGLRVVLSPTHRGIVLFRSLIGKDEQLPEIDAIRRRASCTLIPSAPVS